MKTVTAELLPNGNLLVSVPLKVKQNGNGTRIIAPGEEDTDRGRRAFLLAVARGRRWQQLIDEGKVESIKALATLVGRDASYVARITRLSLVAPEIIERVIDGECIDGLSVGLARRPIPELWSEQVELLTQ